MALQKCGLNRNNKNREQDTKMNLIISYSALYFIWIFAQMLWIQNILHNILIAQVNHM